MKPNCPMAEPLPWRIDHDSQSVSIESSRTASSCDPLRRQLMRYGLTLLVLVAFSLAGESKASGAISIGEPLRVRILYDNSGSMYPGYTPPGSPGRKTKAELGVRFFQEYPDFRLWLADFVANQRLVDGGTIGMWTFTSQGQFTSGDIRQVHPEVPVQGFSVERAVQRFPSDVGQTTYLTETLERFTRGFTGLVWLVTDNIVETRAGETDAEVERFFRSLKDLPRYRSVHLFKYPFRDERAGKTSALAVYGVLVSEADVPETTLAYFDRKFRGDLRFANRLQGDPPAQLFPGREHLKLKNLRVDALELTAVPNLKVILANPEKGQIKEGQRVQLELTGEIKSYLTQHSVTGGRYQLEIAAPFEPEEWARKGLGAKSLSSEAFQPAGGAIEEPIPPNGTREVSALLGSSRPFSLRSPALGAWLRLALNGATVKYTGSVRMSFTDLQVRLERSQMAGIFGIGEASAIFDFQDVKTIAVDPSSAPVSFALTTDSHRTLLLLFALAILAVALGLLALVLGRRQWYRVRITGTPERLIPLRRLGKYQVAHEAQALGMLSRGVSGDHIFVPSANSAALTISATRQSDTWDVRFRDGRACQLTIEAQVSGSAKRRPPREARDRPLQPGAAPTPGIPGSTPNEPDPVRPLPKIDRPSR